MKHQCFNTQTLTNQNTKYRYNYTSKKFSIEIAFNILQKCQIFIKNLKIKIIKYINIKK